MTFKERYFLGEIPFEDIEQYTSLWNFSDETCSLASYLGLNGEEEDIWISKSEEALEELLEKERIAYKNCSSKLFFTDLDGTLLNDAKEVSPANRKAILHARQAGHRIILSSGRAVSSVRRIATELDLAGKDSYFIAFNGSIVYDCGDNRCILNRTLPLKHVISVFEEAQKANIHCHTYQDNQVLYVRDDEATRSYRASTRMPGRMIKGAEDLMEEPHKLLLIDLHDHQKLEDFRAYMQPKFQGQIDFFFSSDSYLEAVPAGVSKGNALHFLSNYLNIPLTNTIAAGDSENDLSMIKEAAIGVAMMNSLESLKKEADYVTQKDNNQDGFSEIIEKFL